MLAIFLNENNYYFIKDKILKFKENISVKKFKENNKIWRLLLKK